MKTPFCSVQFNCGAYSLHCSSFCVLKKQCGRRIFSSQADWMITTHSKRKVKSPECESSVDLQSTLIKAITIERVVSKSLPFLAPDHPDVSVSGGNSPSSWSLPHLTCCDSIWFFAVPFSGSFLPGLLLRVVDLRAAAK